MAKETHFFIIDSISGEVERLDNLETVLDRLAVMLSREHWDDSVAWKYGYSVLRVLYNGESTLYPGKSGVQQFLSIYSRFIDSLMAKI